MPGVVEKLIDTFIEQRTEEERFIDTVRRIGIAPFKTRVYGESANARKVANG